MPKYREVLGNGRWGQLQELDNLAYAELTVPQSQQRPDAALVRKRVGYRQQFTHNGLLFPYLTKYYHLVYRVSNQAVFGATSTISPIHALLVIQHSPTEFPGKYQANGTILSASEGLYWM